MSAKLDTGLGTLLLLHGEIYDQGAGYWIKIDAWQVELSEHVPHGIRYSLTLHDRHGTRLMGYDNAHAVKPPKRKRYAGTRLAYDHKHRHVRDKGVSLRIQYCGSTAEGFFRRSGPRSG